MKIDLRLFPLVTLLLLLNQSTFVAHADVKVTKAFLPGDTSPPFAFADIPRPSRQDAANRAKISLVSGTKDPNGGDLERLNDDRLPQDEDEPSTNFFFAAGTAGGRIRFDLGKEISIRQINTFSWHPGSRAGQVYKVFGGGDDVASSGEANQNAQLTHSGWKLLAEVEHRLHEQDGSFRGGQYGVSISSSEPLRFRYLLFEISQTQRNDRFAQTFFSEIDVLETEAQPIETTQTNLVLAFKEGAYSYRINLSDAPDLAPWTEQELIPVIKRWYPRIVALLPCPGFEAPSEVTIRFRHGMRQTPAAAIRNQISCNIEWFRRNLKGEAVGSVVHELVHVAQQYGRARQSGRTTSRTPGWLTEGIADYVRWFWYEPESRGADITKNNFSRAQYNASYRITGNFLDWVSRNYDEAIVRKLNAAARQGEYREELWKESTGKSVQELGDEWKNFHQKRLGISAAPENPK